MAGSPGKFYVFGRKIDQMAGDNPRSRRSVLKSRDESNGGTVMGENSQEAENQFSGVPFSTTFRNPESQEIAVLARLFTFSAENLTRWPEEG